MIEKLPERENEKSWISRVVNTTQLALVASLVVFQSPESDALISEDLFSDSSFKIDENDKIANININELDLSTCSLSYYYEIFDNMASAYIDSTVDKQNTNYDRALFIEIQIRLLLQKVEKYAEELEVRADFIKETRDESLLDKLKEDIVRTVAFLKRYFRWDLKIMDEDMMKSIFILRLNMERLYSSLDELFDY